MSDGEYKYNQGFMCTPTQYAINRGVQIQEITEESYNSFYKEKGFSTDIIGNKYCAWWIRNTTGNYITTTGLRAITNADSEGKAIRPAMYIQY